MQEIYFEIVKKEAITVEINGFNHSKYFLTQKVYDPDNDGVIDLAKEAKSVEWNNIENKPSEFNPASHNHDDLYPAKEDVNSALSSLQALLDEKAAKDDVDSIANNLQISLNEKAVKNDVNFAVNNLQDSLDGKAGKNGNQSENFSCNDLISDDQVIIRNKAFLYTDESGNLMFQDENTPPVSLQEIDCPKIITLSGSLINNTIVNLTDEVNWNTDKAIIKHIIVNTTSTNWNLILYSDLDEISGNLPSLQIMTAANGNKVIYLDLPYIDNNSSKSVHLKASGIADATVKIFGIKAR